MGKYIRFQFANILKSPVIYLLVFLISPLIFVLTSSFIPAVYVIPGMMVFIIFSVTFFVVGTSIFQTKQTSFLKRLSVLGITKSKFVFSNALVTITLAILSFYAFVELFGMLTAFSNLDVVMQNEENYDKLFTKTTDFNFMVPQLFSIFVIDDLITSLDDAAYIMILDILSVASSELLNDLVLVLNYVLDNATLTFLQKQAIEAVIAIVEGVINNPLILPDLYDEFYELGHAPINIITDILIPSEEVNENGVINGVWNNDGQIFINSGSIYRFYFYNGVETTDKPIGVMFYGNYAPTFGVLLSPLINYDSRIEFTVFEVLSDKTLIYFWSIQFVLVAIVAITAFFIMMLINVFAISFEQYYVISGIFILFTLMFSGMFLPFELILSTPLMYTMAIFLPTTAPILLMNSIAGDNAGYLGLQLDTPIENLFIYPILICLVSMVLTYKMLSRDGGKLVTKFVHDPLSKKSAAINFVASILFFIFSFIFMFILVNQRDNWVHGQNGENPVTYYPTNRLVFYAITITCIYALIAFANLINWNAKSSTFNKHRTIFALMNMVFLFPIGVVTLIMTLNSKTIIANDKFETYSSIKTK